MGFRFCPRLRDLPNRKLATIEPATAYKDLARLIGRRIKAEVIREHWGEILRLAASLQAGTVLSKSGTAVIPGTAGCAPHTLVGCAQVFQQERHACKHLAARHRDSLRLG